MRTDLGHDMCTADMMDRCNNDRCKYHGTGPEGSFTRYEVLAGRTITKDQPNDARRVNAALGLAGEAGEIVELIKKETFHGIPADKDKVRGEVGDVLWYLNQLCYAFDLTLNECAQANVDKLERRYPNGFVKGGGIR